jgi:hypothetical protein
MADCDDADLSEIVAGQLREYLPVDHVFGEGRRILFEAEPAEPFRDLD